VASPRAWLRRPWRGFANRVVGSSTTVRDTVRIELPSALRETPGIVHFDPTPTKTDVVVVPPPRGHGPGDAAPPVPPSTLWTNLERSSDEYLESGRRDTEAMRAALAESGRPVEGARTVLDFGCASGRITRQLLGAVDADTELWGVDVHAPSITWCSENLSPPFQFVTCTTSPHLPFTDGYFDVVIAASVLDTMVELRDAWLLELRRVLAPGGALYLTLVDRDSVEVLLNVAEGHRLAPVGATIRRVERDVGFLDGDWSTVTIQVGSSAHAIYDLDHFRSAWGHFFDIGPPHPRAYAEFETALVLRHASDSP
jgi:SAM-dependent methyltransferase